MPASFFFIDTERVWRGGQDQLFTLLRGLVQRGNRVHLVCYPGTLLETRAHELDIGVDTMAIRSEFDPVSLYRLSKLMCRVRPEIVAFNTPRAILMGNLASRLAGSAGSNNISPSQLSAEKESDHPPQVQLGNPPHRSHLREHTPPAGVRRSTRRKNSHHLRGHGSFALSETGVS